MPEVKDSASPEDKAVVLFIKVQHSEQFDQVAILLESVIEQNYPEHLCVQSSFAGNSIPAQSSWVNHFTDQQLFVVVNCTGDLPVGSYGYCIEFSNINSVDPTEQPMKLVFDNTPQALAELALLCIENAKEYANPTVSKNNEIIAELQKFQLPE